MSQSRRTIRDLLEVPDPNAIALLGEDHTSLTGQGVRDAVHRLACGISSRGITGPNRIAIVVKNGPGAALSFLGTAIAAVAAPLNPAYTEAEFRFALSDLPATALLTDGSSAAALAAASGLRIPTILLAELLSDAAPTTDSAPRSSPDDIALVLHTSGTTGAPKRVPLTHVNLAASAVNIAQSLDLTPTDRCLNVMPLFHIHGLVAAVLASLASGGSVVCTSGFDSFRMVSWLETFHPTWYTAVPTMHQAILARARSRGTRPIKHRLRFVRSSSSALPSSVHHDVENLLGVPFVEAYGMTEASHQISTNPLPPDERLTGSVGKPFGTEVAIFGPDRAAVAPGARGEVAIRGASVTAGYEGIDSTEHTFPGGWLRTGDQGFVDDAGYLHLTGRLKELVNRGGEKVSPLEVEEALLAHPAVREAVVFGVPHEMLGEEVAAAVVLASDVPVPTATELRTFVSGQLAPFKVPRKIVFVEQIPLGPTGKPQRVGLGQRLGLA